MKIRLTKQLSQEELVVLIALGMRDERDFVVRYENDLGKVVMTLPEMGWDAKEILQSLQDSGNWRAFLFEEIE